MKKIHGLKGRKLTEETKQRISKTKREKRPIEWIEQLAPYENLKTPCWICTSHAAAIPHMYKNYEAIHGPKPEGLVYRHKCDNIMCINPDHLETGTNSDNMQDMHKRGRFVGTTGMKHSDETKLKQRNVKLGHVAWNKGLTHKEDARIGNPTLIGKKRDPSIGENLSKIKKGKKLNKITRKYE